MAPAVFQSPYFLTAASLEKLDAQINKETIEKFLSKNPTDSSLGGQTSAGDSRFDLGDSISTHDDL